MIYDMTAVEGSFLDEEADVEESEEEKVSIVEEQTTDEELTDEEGATKAKSKLQTSPDDSLEETHEANDEDEQ
ncbi:Hypothetical predicted protein [Octopus vulgaris]|uniref:Uncharacterized protein n=1 Tax=Octopus vulgaris TaxID=6645 RepID=A0AA36B2Q3_OCTVU|nr:Hypothetical predicted protein [Octopus vulgaris]